MNVAHAKHSAAMSHGREVPPADVVKGNILVRGLRRKAWELREFGPRANLITKIIIYAQSKSAHEKIRLL
tara:strand:- start:1061 stop:1270 length:210 start_codon:yes stop_codon:yes gene_type:complete